MATELVNPSSGEDKPAVTAETLSLKNADHLRAIWHSTPMAT
jgi:hypothetical protein